MKEKKKGFSCCRVIRGDARERESSPPLSPGVNHFPPPVGVTERDEICVNATGKSAICLIDVTAWYVPSVSSRQALGGLVPRREMYSPRPVSAAEGQRTTGGNGNIYVLSLHTLPGAREREDRAPAGVIYRLGSADSTGAFSP